MNTGHRLSTQHKGVFCGVHPLNRYHWYCYETNRTHPWQFHVSFHKCFKHIARIEHVPPCCLKGLFPTLQPLQAYPFLCIQDWGRNRGCVRGGEGGGGRGGEGGEGRESETMEKTLKTFSHLARARDQESTSGDMPSNSASIG